MEKGFVGNVDEATVLRTENLVKKYYEALNHNDIVGLVIGTRPDSISPWARL